MPGAPFTRRTFIQTVTGGAVGGALLYSFPPDARARYILASDLPVASDDEHFWTVVRDQFPLKTDLTFLNNGTMGPSPYVVIDALTNELQSVERSARYGGWEDVRPKIAQFIHAAAEEISLTHNVTEGINIVASGLPLKRGTRLS